jgi:hypothetical protein
MEIYYKMLEWLYLNDKNFESALLWRKEFLTELRNLLIDKEKRELHPLFFVGSDPKEVIADLLKHFEEIDKGTEPM